jgi:hypothetical protein
MVKHLLAAAALAIVLVPAAAHAQATMLPGKEGPRPLPPLEYDHAFNGPTIIIRGDATLMKQLCPATRFPITLGCQRFLVDARDVVTPTPLGKTCIIIVAKDEILQAQGWTYEIVKRHERGHCNGFSHDHRGARPLGAPEGAPLIASGSPL